MTASLDAQTARRELAQTRTGNRLYVTVLDDAGDSFELSVRPDEALGVFNHPFAYAASHRSVLLDVAA